MFFYYFYKFVKSDFLLIWLDAEADIIEILRLGSHSELFKKY